MLVYFSPLDKELKINYGSIYKGHDLYTSKLENENYFVISVTIGSLIQPGMMQNVMVEPKSLRLIAILPSCTVVLACLIGQFGPILWEKTSDGA